jgi:hypothetical protein
MPDVNLVAVLVAAVVSFMIGWAWYSPMLFGNIWMKESGIKMPAKITPEIKKQMMRSMSLGFLFAFLTNYIFARFLGSMNVYSAGDVVQLGFWIWLGFTLPVVMTGYLWENKTFHLVLIAAGQTFVSLLVGGLLISAMS